MLRAFTAPLYPRIRHCAMSEASAKRISESQDLESESKRAKIDDGSSSSRPVQKTKKKKDVVYKRRGRNAEGTPPLDDGSPKEPRLPKRQCALLLGFCGSAYRGMQYQKPPPGQPDYPTIEGELFEALIRAGAISKDNANDPLKVNLARAARTDAGVHAAGNIVSLKMITAIPGQQETMLERINRELPQDIRVWDFIRVQNSFSARTSCDSRKYIYFFPSYLLLPPKPGSGILASLQRAGRSLPSLPGSSFWEGHESDTLEQDLVRKRLWRVSDDYLEPLKNIAQKFEGTHNFHNFTMSREPKEATNSRFLKSVEIEPPAIYGGTEWLAVKLHGQSFMIHQIRKMMFALIMSCRTGTPATLIEQLYSPHSTVFIPKMPALGLLLEYPLFDVYNTRVQTLSDLAPSHPDYRPKIDFGLHEATMKEFKQKYIYDRMRDVEDRKGLFDAWICSVDSYSGDELLYLNTEGRLLPEVLIRKGEARTMPFRENRTFDRTSFAMDDTTKITLDSEDMSDDAEVDVIEGQKEAMEMA
ncbi:pseudouridine synthase [Mycena floridula]|nr:pseudouridine synthase [Mycena floridula]